MNDKKQGVVWDLTSFFPNFNGPEMIAFKKKLEEDIKKLQARAEGLGPLTEDNMTEWESIIVDSEDFYVRSGHLGSYIGCLSAADATNEEYKKEDGVYRVLLSEAEKLEVDVLHAFKGLDNELLKKFISSEALKDTEHYHRRILEKAEHTMSRQEEVLASELNVNGLHAWGRLYDSISGKLEFDMTMPDGETVRKPISEWRSLMSGPDFDIGKAAFLGGNEAWRGIENVCAAALNAISGVRLSLYKNRGIDHFLDMALFQSNIQKETLDAMYKAIHDNIEIPREIFRAKSDYMGRKGIWWFEREAPLPLEEMKNFSWEDGSGMVGKSFATVYPALSEYYGSFLNDRWIESEKRGGKRPGAFCTGSHLTGEQRVYMTFNGALGDVTTLAHEVGHAWHGHLLKKLRPIARRYPMTLAETASIFAEHILAEGIYKDDSIDDSGKLLMLDADVCNAAVLLLDITVRFEFEKAFHEERMKGEVSVSRLKELMIEKQREIWGDAMAEGSEDEMFWASKLHFYITQVTFYNFPYTFGFLLARTLYNLFQKEGESFLARYEEFLMLTGSDTVENVAKRSIGVDLTDPGFWAAGIKSVEEPLKLYKELLLKRKSE
ncbi:M3 family oligoendopeptidase [bacterium]|nr:M3 family oligoendopeptidase [bacterium]MBU1026026.1 M3 family oligoendopeptidase [bacterium]